MILIVSVIQRLHRFLVSRDESDSRYSPVTATHPILSQHVLRVSHLPDIHKAPFDRMLVAQAQSEGFMLLTSDERIASYPGPVKLV